MKYKVEASAKSTVTIKITFTKQEWEEANLKAYQQTKGNIRFDCKELAFIDSTTLGTFVKILKAVKSDGFEMSLVGLQPKIKKLFVICSLDTIMRVE